VKGLRPEGITAALLLMAIIAANIFAPILAPYPPNEVHMKDRLQGPSPTYPLGTDALGRDMLSRALYGGRASILLALGATVLSMLAGVIMGVLAGFYGGAMDWLITTVTNIFQGLPGTCFTIAIAGVLGPGNLNLMLALVITSWAGFSRIVRTEVMKLKEEPYIESLRCLGCGDMRLILRHILPGMLSSTLVLFTTRVGRALLSIASLSFLGLGVRPPTPDWSVMINDARLNYRSAPHLVLVPGACLFLTLLAVNLLGDALRDYFDIKNREVRSD